MNGPSQLFNEYVRDRRNQDYDRCLREDLGYLIRYTPQSEMDGWVTFARLPQAGARSIIAEQVEHFRAQGKGFEWKVYGFDAPGDLQSLLAEQGFVAEKDEAFMLYPVSVGSVPRPREGSCDIVRIDTEGGVLDVISVQERVWKQDFAWLRGQLLSRLAGEPERISLYCAYVEGRPVGTGWTDFPEGSKFPEVHGGAVLEEYRGRGIYTALYLRRLAEVADRKYAWIAVDASPMSRPILRKLGFIHVCNTVPMCYRAASA